MIRRMIRAEESFAAWRTYPKYGKVDHALGDDFSLAATMIEARAPVPVSVGSSWPIT
jgi:hypothetical protein